MSPRVVSFDRADSARSRETWHQRKKQCIAGAAAGLILAALTASHAIAKQPAGFIIAEGNFLCTDEEAVDDATNVVHDSDKVATPRA